MTAQANNYRRISRLLSIVCALLSIVRVNAQNTGSDRLEKMPVGLETDYALSALPPHLRSEATVYLLDPQRGFYIGRQGTNGFICFVSRTDSCPLQLRHFSSENWSRNSPPFNVSRACSCSCAACTTITYSRTRASAHTTKCETTNCAKS